MPIALFALFAFLPLSWAGEPKDPYVYEWDTGTNPVPNDAYFTIDYDTKVLQRTGPSGEQIRAFQMGQDDIEPEYLPVDHWGEPTYGYRLSLRMEHLTIPLGSPVSATVVVRNNSTNTFRFSAGINERDYQFVVIDSKKRLVPLTEYGKGLLKRVDRWPHVTFLIPRSQRKLDFQIDKIFDLSVKGEYLIYVKRSISVDDDNNPDAFLHSEVVSGNARFQIVDASKTAGQSDKGNTVAATSSSSVADNSGMPSTVGNKSSANSQPSARATEPQSTANPLKNILQPAPKAAANKTPAQLAQAETGGGWSSRDWVFGLLVLGLVLGLGGLLFRARASRPRS